MRKRWLSAVLTISLVIGMIPLSTITALAKNTDYSGTCGEDVHWEYDNQTETLTITGTGSMEDTRSVRGEWQNLYPKVLIIEEGVTTIPDYAFNSLSWLREVTVPNSVATIGKGAFCECRYLEKVTLGNGVTCIEQYAFSECENLTSITIPKSVTTIESYAFERCNSLESVILADGVTSIKEEAFYYCESLITLTIPKSVVELSERAFLGCNALEQIEVDSENTTFCSIDGVVFSKDEKTIHTYPKAKEGSYTIPADVSVIGDWAFESCVYLTSVTMQENVVEIGQGSFWGCTGFETILIPESVVTIGESAFDFCNLTEVSIPKSVISIGDLAFSYNRNLASVRFQSGLQKIGHYAFSGCGLTSVWLPDSVNELDVAAFECSDLVSIQIDVANGTYSSQGGAVLSENGKTLYTVPNGMTGKYIVPSGVKNIGRDAFDGCHKLDEVEISSGVETVRAGAFGYYGNSTIKSVLISETVTSIERTSSGHAFVNCLTEAISVHSDNPTYMSKEGVLFNKDGSILEAYPRNKTGAYAIPEGVTEIWAMAFWEAKLTSVTLPDSIQEIGSWAFAYCEKLEEVNISNNVQSIDTRAFMQCKSLTNVTIPKSVERIGGDVFSGAENLEQVTIYNPNLFLEDSEFVGDHVILWGYTGSTTQQYAVENGNPFLCVNTYSNYYKQVGKCAVVTRNKNGTTITGCTITVDGKEYLSEGHTLFVDIPEGYTGTIEVAKEGYITSSLPAEFLKKYNFFVMYSDTEETPVVQHLLLRDAQSTNNDYTDLLHSEEYIYDLGNKRHDLYVDINTNGKVINSIYLQQGNTKVTLQQGMNQDINTNGFFISDNGTIYLCATTSDGKIYKYESSIIACQERLTLDADIEDSISGTVDEEMEAIGGWEFTGELQLGKVPISVTIEEGKVKGAIGIQGNEEATATWYQAIQQTIKAHEKSGKKEYTTEEMESLAKKLDDSGGDVAEGYSTFGIDVEGSIIGYVEGTWNTETNKIENVEIGMILTMSGKMSYTQQSSVVIVSVPVPYYWTVEFGVELATMINGDFSYDANNKVSFAMEMPEMSVGVQVSGSLCLGLNEIIGGGGKVTGEVKVTFNGPNYDFTSSVWEATLEIGVTGQLAGFSGDFVAWNGTHQIYGPEASGKTLATPQNLMSEYVENSVLLAQAYSLEQAEYLTEAVEDDSEYTFKSNGYTYSSPMAATLSDGTVVMVWVDYAEEREAINKTALYYSVYDVDNNEWSVPLQVDDDGTADDLPVLKTINDKIYLVWNDADEILESDATLFDVISSMGISYAEFDGTEFEAITSVSGRNNYMDICADVAVIDSTPCVVWLKNQQNDIFGQQGTNVLMSATYEDAQWNETNVLESASTINSFTIVEEDNTMSIYYSKPSEDNAETVDNYEIYKIRNDVVEQITENQCADTAIAAYDNVVYWKSGDSIRCTEQQIVCTGIGQQYVIVEKEDGYRSLIYNIDEKDGSTSYMLCDETEEGFGLPTKLTGGEYISGGITAYCQNNALKFISNEVSLSDMSAEINVYHFAKEAQLIVENVYYDQYTLIQGGQLCTDVTVTNNGYHVANEYTIYAYDGDDLLASKRVTTSLAPGEEDEKTILLNLADDVTFEEIRFYVVMSGEWLDLEQPSYVLELSLTDVSVENVSVVSDETVKELYASIVNRGLKDISEVTVCLRARSSDGEVLKSCVVENISGQNEEILTFDLSEYDEDIKKYYVTIDTLEDERFIGNNSDFGIINTIRENDVIVGDVIDLYTRIELNEAKEITVGTENRESIFVFIPEQDGEYRFYSYDNNFDTYGHIYNSDMKQIASDDDGAGNGNFCVKYNMAAGEVYYLKARPFNNSSTGSYSVVLEKEVAATSLEITNGATIKGYIGDEYYLDTQFSPEDATKESITWTSSNSSVVRVDSDGWIYLLSAGTATITATSKSGLTDRIIVTVSEIPEIEESAIQTVTFETSGEEKRYRFVPDETGIYNFHINSEDDIQFAIYDSAQQQINSSWSSVSQQLSAGETYTIEFYNQSDEAHTLTFKIIASNVDHLEIVSGISYIENCNGWENTYYNPETGQYESYYHYNDYYPNSIEIKIVYKDGTSVRASAGDLIDGYEVQWDAYESQSESPWTVGDDNVTTITYQGVSIELPVTVVENPVDYIELISAPTKEYVYGDETYGWYYEEVDYYEFHPTDLEGLAFSVYYKDGTNKVYSYNDIDEDDFIDGFPYELYYESMGVNAGELPVTFSYMGKEVEYTVLLKESTVESIVVTKNPDKMEYLEYYAPDFTGMELTIAYTDGTSKITSITKDNMVYEYDWSWGELLYKVEVDGYTLYIEPYYAEEEMYYTISYLGAQCEFKDISFVEAKKITSVDVSNVSKNGDGMQIKVTYADGTTETLTMESVVYKECELACEGYGKTDNGFLYYYIQHIYNDSGEIEKYNVKVFENSIESMPQVVLTGDVNSDGEVNNLDRQILTRHLAKWAGYEVDKLNVEAADVNGDGEVNNLDRQILTRHLAKWAGYEELPYSK